MPKLYLSFLVNGGILPLGWTFIRAFDNAIVRRLESRNKSQQQNYHTATLYAGTPRGLMLVDGAVGILCKCKIILQTRKFHNSL